MRAPLCLTLAAMACCCEPCTVQAPGVALKACSACEKLMQQYCSTTSAAGTRICTACSEAAKTHALRRSHRSRMMSDKAAAAWAFTVPDPNPLPAAGDADETDSSNITSSSSDPDSSDSDSDDATMASDAGGKRKRQPSKTSAASSKKKRDNAFDTANEAEEAAHRTQVMDMAMLTTEARIKVKANRHKKMSELKRVGRTVAAHHRPDYVVESHAPSNLAEIEVPTPSLVVQAPTQARIPQLTVVQKMGGVWFLLNVPVLTSTPLRQAKRMVAAHKPGTLYKNKERLLIHAAAVDLGLVSNGGQLRWKHSASLRQAANLLGVSRSTLKRMLMKPLSEYANEHDNLVRQSVSKFPILDADIYRWFMCRVLWATQCPTLC